MGFLPKRTARRRSTRVERGVDVVRVTLSNGRVTGLPLSAKAEKLRRKQSYLSLDKRLLQTSGFFFRQALQDLRQDHEGHIDETRMHLHGRPGSDQSGENFVCGTARA
jgi:hypothetical protein